MTSIFVVVSLDSLLRADMIVVYLSKSPVLFCVSSGHLHSLCSLLSLFPLGFPSTLVSRSVSYFEQDRSTVSTRSLDSKSRFTVATRDTQPGCLSFLQTEDCSVDLIQCFTLRITQVTWQHGRPPFQLRLRSRPWRTLWLLSGMHTTSLLW